MVNLLIIDASGSMSNLVNDVKGGIKQTFEDIKQADMDPSLFKHTRKKTKSRTIVYDFSEKPVLLCDEADSEKLDSAIAENYKTRGSTALYDAIGEAFALVPADEKKVMVTIITDGEENASRKFSGAQIKEIIEAKKANGWAILFIGADEKCINTARSIGVSSGNTMAFTAEAGHYAGANAVLGNELKSKRGSHSNMFYARQAYMSSTDSVASIDLLEESEKMRLSNDKNLGLLSEEDEKDALSNLKKGKEKMKIGIVILATNSYFVLGVRFITKFMQYYKGKANITFYFFSNGDPKSYVPFSNVVWINTQHESWVEATNSKFKSIVSLVDKDEEYLYYFDADTSINKDFTEEWFIGDLVGGEHYCNRYEGRKPYDRNPISKAYVPLDTPLPQTYYYGAFFGGKKQKVLDFCRILILNQLEDKKIPYEPGVNDESYINQYFHYNPPTTVSTEKFAFLISDKGGMKDTRFINTNINLIKNEIKKHKTSNWDIINGKFTLI